MEKTKLEIDNHDRPPDYVVRACECMAEEFVAACPVQDTEASYLAGTVRDLLLAAYSQEEEVGPLKGNIYARYCSCTGRLEVFSRPHHACRYLHPVPSVLGLD